LGTVSLDYQISDQPVFGEWRIRVVAQGQIEENTFVIEEYYQTRFEVNVTMAPFIFTTDQFLEGTVMANYTGGAPVQGNLTLKATVRPYRSSNLYNRDLTPISERYFFFVSIHHNSGLNLVSGSNPLRNHVKNIKFTMENLAKSFTESFS